MEGAAMSNIPQHLQDKDGVSEEALPALIAEFTALRDEILKRSEFQQQLTSLALIATGTFLTISLQSSTQAFLLLIYPS